MYTEIFGISLILLIENWFGEDEFIFQGENISGHRAKIIEIKSRIYTVNRQNLNLNENLWWKFCAMVHGNKTKATIWGIEKPFEKQYYFWLVKLITERKHDEIGLV